ncbi:MAG TPA: phosphoesterase [Saprospiraceae bacterium]|nr:phosphoesterase [Saprospiraceae bacterium]
MKNKYIIPFSLIITILFFACEKDLPTHLTFDAYEFASIDSEGGSWKPVLISTGNAISLAAPASVNSSEYLQEIEDVKAERAKMTNADIQTVIYWSHNPIIRWNEIALELTAKYNLIPGPNPDGTYTLPNPANPAGPPPFPFANPPYAVRVFAYLSVAQFDGLISAWHYKFNYNRAAPYVYDSNIQPIYSANNIPAYPSDGAVIATVSRRILTQMFPLEADYLAKKEAEHLRCLLLSGTNVQSDIDAGKTIGAAISTIALSRAADDGMRNAQAPKAVSDSMAAAAKQRFGWEWVNMEIPKRPVGLAPLYGRVKTWNVKNVEDTRPGPPPAIGSPEFEADVAILKEYARNVTAERRRIANFWQDGLGTYTPPGHWNQFAKELIVKYRFNPLRSARTFAYLNMSMTTTLVRFKLLKGSRPFWARPISRLTRLGTAFFRRLARRSLLIFFLRRLQEPDNGQKKRHFQGCTAEYTGLLMRQWVQNKAGMWLNTPLTLHEKMAPTDAGVFVVQGKRTNGRFGPRYAP